MSDLHIEPFSSSLESEAVICWVLPTFPEVPGLNLANLHRHLPAFVIDPAHLYERQGPGLTHHSQESSQLTDKQFMLVFPLSLLLPRRAELMEAVTVKKPPVSDRSVSVISHNLHSNTRDLTINLQGASDISKLLVVVLVGGLQSGEVFPAPGFPGHGSGHCPGLHVGVKIKVGEVGPELSVNVDGVERPGLPAPHLPLELDPPDLHGRHWGEGDSSSLPAT